MAGEWWAWALIAIGFARVVWVAYHPKAETLVDVDGYCHCVEFTGQHPEAWHR